MANIAVPNAYLSDTSVQKKPRKLATDPTYKPLTKHVQRLLKGGFIAFFSGGLLALLIEQYLSNISVISQFLLFGLAFVILYGGFFLILWGLFTLLIRWMKSVNRRRVMDNRPKVKWWLWILLTLIVIWFLAMVLILGL